MDDIANFCPLEARKQATAEIGAYRERIRREKEARESASAEARVTRAMDQAKKEIADDLHREAMQAERERMYAQRDAAIASRRQADRERKLEADPRLRIGDTPARRLAKRLRAHLGTDFDAFVADLRLVNVRQLFIELERIPGDERAEAAACRNAEIAAKHEAEAEAAMVPEPANDDERAILRRHGIPA